MKTEKNILIAFLLNVLFSVFEFVGGLFTGSVAIMSDSIHDLGDAMCIGVSYFLERKSKQKPDSHHTYGYIRYSVFGSVITTVILLVGSILVIYESIKRIVNPIDINYNGMIIFAVLGVTINFIASYVTREGDSLNQKSVNLHMLEDILGWIIVLIGSILMKFTNISLLDPILSIGVSTFIFINAITNLKEVLDIFLEVTPKNIDIKKLKECLLSIDGIVDIHHIHVRSIDGFNNFATIHIVVHEYQKSIKDKVRQELNKQGICHSTIEMELQNEQCHNKECTIIGHHPNHHH